LTTAAGKNKTLQLKSASFSTQWHARYGILAAVAGFGVAVATAEIRFTYSPVHQ